jgi:hypothetical protein
VDVGLLSSVSAIAIVGYVGFVMAHGNLVPLLENLKKDWRFLEWAAAVGILYFLAKESDLHGPIVGLIGLAIIVFLLRHVSGVKAAENDMAKGNLFQALLDLSK